jgi:hypothetical protein
MLENAGGISTILDHEMVALNAAERCAYRSGAVERMQYEQYLPIS